MQGLMMHEPLMLSRLIDHAAAHFPNTEVVGRNIDGSISRNTWSGMRHRAMQLAQALRRLGVGTDSRIASLAWNTLDHLDVYYAVLGLGLPLHTLNPRLSVDDLQYMIDLVDDSVCFIDAGTIELAAQLAPKVPRIRHWIYMGGDGSIDPQQIFPGLLMKDALMGAEDGALLWPRIDENAAATICFTSGTTGRPKGVVYSHRSITLSALSMSLASMYAAAPAGESSVTMPIAAMFHANAWMMPFSAPMNGQKLVLPGRNLDAPHVVDLIVREKVTIAGAVPTVWQDVLSLLAGKDKSGVALHTALVAGTIMPDHLYDRFTSLGIRPCQSWGMTEVPGAALGTPPPGSAALPDAERRTLAIARQGRVSFLSDMRIVDDAGTPLPHDGATAGHLQVRGPTVVGRYLGEAESETRDWLTTGDIVRLHPDSSVELVDRAKDVIKSGGEWISSPQLESAAASHPAVRTAAVIGKPHPRWQERPLLVCVLEDGQTVTPDALRDHMLQHVVKWWLPEDILFVPALPMTTTGKIDKVALRRSHLQPA